MNCHLDISGASVGCGHELLIIRKHRNNCEKLTPAFIPYDPTSVEYQGGTTRRDGGVGIGEGASVSGRCPPPPPPHPMDSIDVLSQLADHARRRARYAASRIE